MTTLTTEPATGQRPSAAQNRLARGAQLPSGRRCADAPSPLAGGSNFPTDHRASDALRSDVGGEQAGRDRTFSDAPSDHVTAVDSPQAESIAASSDEPPAGAQTDDRDHDVPDAQTSCVPVVTKQGQPAVLDSFPNGEPLADPTLALAADVLDDLERVKIANANRLRQLTRDVEDSDGEMRGFGLDESHPDVARLAAMVATLEQLEHDAVLNLRRAMRKHPLGPWVKAQKGVGEKQAARLLATIGDPCLNGATGEYRTVSQLWAYCGLHVLPASQAPLDAHSDRAGGGSISGGDPGPVPRATHRSDAGVAARRTKGIKANWSTLAKTRAWLIVESCMKQIDAPCKTDSGIGDHLPGCECSPYRVAVDERRRHTATTHPEWTPGHSLNDGMRIASKRLLRDLWREARRLHGFPQEN